MKFSSALRILVLGCGNTDWLDDGLGPALADAVGRLELPGVSTEYCDGLMVEDAASVAAHDIVIFAGAGLRGAEPFAFRTLRAVKPGPAAGCGSMDAAALLGLTSRLYRRSPDAYLLAIRGYAFGPGSELSPQAADNLAKAVAFLEAAIRLRLAA